MSLRSNHYPETLPDDSDAERERHETETQPCGYCSGTGWYWGRTHDNLGYPITQRKLTCEYCGGSGRCVDGHKLLPAVDRSPKPDPNPNAGNPSWA